MRVNKAKDEQAVVVRMPTDLHQAIKERAAADERTMSQAIRYAVKQYLDGCTAPALADQAL